MKKEKTIKKRKKRKLTQIEKRIIFTRDEIYKIGKRDGRMEALQFLANRNVIMPEIIAELLYKWFEKDNRFKTRR